LFLDHEENVLWPVVASYAVFCLVVGFVVDTGVENWFA